MGGEDAAIGSYVLEARLARDTELGRWRRPRRVLKLAVRKILEHALEAEIVVVVGREY